MDISPFSWSPAAISVWNNVNFHKLQIWSNLKTVACISACLIIRVYGGYWAKAIIYLQCFQIVHLVVHKKLDWLSCYHNLASFSIPHHECNTSTSIHPPSQQAGQVSMYQNILSKDARRTKGAGYLSKLYYCMGLQILIVTKLESYTTAWVTTRKNNT